MEADKWQILLSPLIEKNILSSVQAGCIMNQREERDGQRETLCVSMFFLEPKDKACFGYSLFIRNCNYRNLERCFMHARTINPFWPTILPAAACEGL